MNIRLTISSEMHCILTGKVKSSKLIQEILSCAVAGSVQDLGRETKFTLKSLSELQLTLMDLISKDDENLQFELAVIYPKGKKGWLFRGFHGTLICQIGRLTGSGIHFDYVDESSESYSLDD